MTIDDRLKRLLVAPTDQLEAIDRILEGKVPEPPPGHEDQNYRLLRVSEACKMTNLTYPTFHRAMQAGCFDIVTATGKTLITEKSIAEFARGLRTPSKAVLAARSERATKMRENYRAARRKTA